MTTTATEPRSVSARARSWAPDRIGDTQVEIALVAAMVGAILLNLWLGRDTTFSVDEASFFSTTPDLGVQGALEPYNGHLILVPRLAYDALLHLSGPDYLYFRLLAIGAVLLTAALFFAFARRRVGALAALALTLPLLFFGTDYQHVITGNGFTILFTQAAGIGALLALDREDPKGDALACVLLLVAVATYSEGLPFVVGAAVLILLGPDRRRRAWVFLIPAVLYAAWLLWAHDRSGGAEDSVTLSNLLLFPNWAFNSLATSAASLLGLNYAAFGTGWGPPLAILALAALGLRLWQGSIPRFLWATLAVAGALWLIGAAATAPPARVPDSPRYLYPSSIAILLVAVEAARGVRIQRRGMMILYVIAAISLATNIALLRDGSKTLRMQADVARADFTAIELDRGRLGPNLPTIGFGLGGVLRTTGEGDVATGYLAAVRQFGSPAFSLPELRAQDESTRDEADAALADANGISLRPTGPPAGRCVSTGKQIGQGFSFQLPEGGAVLRSSGIAAPLLLRRFGSSFTVQAGELTPGVWMALPVPRDSAPDPWYASTSATPLQICRPPL